MDCPGNVALVFVSSVLFREQERINKSEREAEGKVLLKYIYLLYVCECFARLRGWAWREPAAHGGKRRGPDPLELELPRGGNQVLCKSSQCFDLLSPLSSPEKSLLKGK